MGLAWVQNDCKTKWIPNIWKNEEKGRGACKTLAPADVWVPPCLPWALGAGQGEGHTALPTGDVPRCERGAGVPEPKPEWAERLDRADQVGP